LDQGTTPGKATGNCVLELECAVCLSSGPDWLHLLPYRSIPGYRVCSLGLLDRLARTFLEYRVFRVCVNFLINFSSATRLERVGRSVEPEVRNRNARLPRKQHIKSQNIGTVASNSLTTAIPLRNLALLSIAVTWVWVAGCPSGSAYIAFKRLDCAPTGLVNPLQGAARSSSCYLLLKLLIHPTEVRCILQLASIGPGR
jgi:hypothetical protein